MLLDVARGELELSTLKILVLCITDVRMAAMDGTTGTLFYSVCMCIRVFLLGDVEVCESYNSLIRIQCTRAPNIKLPLLGSRINLKKQIGTSGRGRWSRLRSAAVQILTEFQEANAIKKDWVAAVDVETRWRPAPALKVPPESDLKKAQLIIDPTLKPSRDKIWACEQSLVLHRHRAAANVKFAYAVLPHSLVREGDELFVVAEKSYSFGMGVLANVLRDDDGVFVKIIMPFQPTSTIDFWLDRQLAIDLNSPMLFEVALKWDFSQSRGVHAIVTKVVKVGNIKSPPGAVASVSSAAALAAAASDGVPALADAPGSSTDGEAASTEVSLMLSVASGVEAGEDDASRDGYMQVCK
jgi:hypothetical protein